MLSLILYTVLVDKDFAFNMYDKFKSLIFKEQAVEIDEPVSINSPEEIVDKADQPVNQVPTRRVVVGNANPVVDENAAVETEDANEVSGQQNVQKSSIKDTLLRMASSFSERFGSYSNHSNFSNIETLKVFMTKRMQKWADTYVLQAKEAGGDKSIYYGMTTKSISTNLEEYDEDTGTAKISVKTRRIEAVGDTENKSQAFSQDIDVYFVKENNIWKIDGAYWLN